MKLGGGGGGGGGVIGVGVDSVDMLGMPVDTLLMSPWSHNHSHGNNDFANADVRHFLTGEDTKLTLGAAGDTDDEIGDQKPTIDDLDLLLTTAATTTTTSLHQHQQQQQQHQHHHHHHHHHQHHHQQQQHNGQGGASTNNSNTTSTNTTTPLTTTTTTSSTVNHTNNNSSNNNNNNNNNNTLAELKPLPPFTGYTGHLSINGISGHHYHAIATAPNSSTTPRIMVETNNNSVDTTNQNNVAYYSTDHVVSSSTMDNALDGIKSESAASVVLDHYGLHNDCIDDDFAAIISSAMADTTVPGNHADGDDSRDSWLDLDAWIVSHCGQSTSPTSSKTTVTVHSGNPTNGVLCPPDTLADFVTNSQFAVNPTAGAPPPPPSQVLAYVPSQQQLKAQPQPGPPPPPPPPPQSSHHHGSQARGGAEINSAAGATTAPASTTFPHMPLLQSRLQNGPPKQEPAQDIGYNIVSECPSPSSSTPYLAHSPPCHVVSTSDIGFIQVHSSTRPSPELQVSFPHTTTPSKKSRNRAKSKVASSIVYNDGNLGKEKTVHRCNICNRGFLNKSNIKVHLRTHTGEKPFRCEVCGKAFRQKAHLIKHAQIHKRVGRD